MKDRIKSGEITIRYCPTHQMLADCFTKPLQGQLFRRFKDVVLGHQHVHSLQDIIAVPLEEPVEDKRSCTSDFLVKGMDPGKRHTHVIPTCAEVVKTSARQAIYDQKRYSCKRSSFSSKNPVILIRSFIDFLSFVVSTVDCSVLRTCALG